jgi:hypothetical protein
MYLLAAAETKISDSVMSDRLKDGINFQQNTKHNAT